MSQRAKAEEEAELHYTKWPDTKEEFPEWDDAPGHVDIQWACNQVYGEQDPFPQFTTLIKYWMGGEDPLDYCNCYLSKDGTHWHYISMGFTNLRVDKLIGNGPQGENGFGFELTFRLVRQAGERVGPTWPFGVMQEMARYVFSSGNILLPEEAMSVENLLERNCPGTSMTAFLTMEDPEIKAFETERGTVRFLQLLATTKEECQAAMQWSKHGMLELLCEGNPLGVSDMSRGSIMDDEEAQQRVQRGREESGSSLGILTAEHPVYFKKMSEEEPARLRLLLNQEAGIKLLDALPYRIPFGRHFGLADTQGPMKEPDATGFRSASITFHPSEEVKIEAEDLPNGGALVHFYMTSEFCAAFVGELQGMELREYRWEDAPGLELEVVPAPSQPNARHDE